MENIKLKKPYTFEDKVYTEIDMSGAEKLTVQDAIDAQKATAGETAALVLPMTSMAFNLQLAAQATKLPIEFFKLLPMRAAQDVKLAMQTCLNGEKQNKGLLMELDKPFNYNGKKYKEVEFTGADTITGVDMTMAENEVAATGTVVTTPGNNFLYCCLMAARASGLDKEFFTKLPICETMKIHTMVNSESFFG